MARVSGLHKVIFIILFGVGMFLIIYGNSIGIACLCPEGVPCPCIDYAGLTAMVAGTVSIAAAAGLYLFQRYRKVEVLT